MHRCACREAPYSPANERHPLLPPPDPHILQAAVAYVLDAVKARAPVWKREEYADGGSTWKENCECTWSPSNESQVPPLKESVG